MENDYLDSEMTPMAVAPDTTTPRVFGILNILFSLLGACIAAYALMMAVFMPVMAKTMEEASKAMEEASAAEIEALEEEEAAATTEEEKAEIRTEIDQLKTRPNADMANPFAAMTDPKVSLYGMVDGSTGLFFNLLMFISGIGLLVRKEWARKLAIWTAGLKIIRLIGLESVNMLFIIPIKMKHMQAMFEQMNVGGQGVDTTEMAGMQGMMFTSWAVVLLVVGCIYPALTLWFLSRPGVKVACQQDIETTSIE
jgi:hypothetical protein